MLARVCVHTCVFTCVCVHTCVRTCTCVKKGKEGKGKGKGRAGEGKGEGRERGKEGEDKGKRGRGREGVKACSDTGTWLVAQSRREVGAWLEGDSGRRWRPAGQEGDALSISLAENQWR